MNSNEAYEVLNKFYEFLQHDHGDEETGWVVLDMKPELKDAIQVALGVLGDA